MKNMFALSLSAALGVALLGSSFAVAQTVSQASFSDRAPIIFLKPGQTVATVSQSGLGPVGTSFGYAIHTPAHLLKPGQSPVGDPAPAP